MERSPLVETTEHGLYCRAGGFHIDPWRDVDRAVITHTHADHSPAACRIAEATGAELVGLAAPGSGRHDISFQPDRLYRHGEKLSCDEFNIELIHTPGHVSNHLCYLLLEESLLFTGDHILQGTTSVILPPDGNMADYMDSLRHLRARQLALLAPGHGEVITDAPAAIDALIAHRNGRERKILQTLAPQGEVDLATLTRQVYDDVPPQVLPIARLTLEAHLIKLQQESRVLETPSGWKLLQ